MPDRTTPEGVQDPSAAAKDRDESALAALLGGLLGEQQQRILEYIQEFGIEPGREFWEDEAQTMSLTLTPFLTGMFVDGVLGMSDGLGIGVDIDTAQNLAAEWARGYAYELVTGLNKARRRALQGALSDYFRAPDMTLGELTDMLTGRGLWGPLSAQRIAVTEVTRAYAQGVAELERLYREMGLQTETIWQTNNDELVCIICGPRHGKNRTDGGWYFAPPAHPNCRCWIDTVILPPEL